MTKHHLEEPTVLYKASDELDLDRRPNKRSRKVTEGAKGHLADDGAEATEKLLKKERKERKRLKKLEDYKSHQPSTITEVAESTCTLSVEGETDDAVKAARKAVKATKQLRKQAKDHASIASSSTRATDPESDEIHTTASTTPSSIATTLAIASTQSGYSEHPALTALSQSSIASFLSSNFIRVDDPLITSQSLRPITMFAYLPITDQAQRAPFKFFSSPTPIQAAAWPFLLSGRDVIGVAETGSGKTLAFGVPCIQYISSLPKEKRSRRAKAVIVSPTRELAVQIHEQIKKLATPAGLEAVCVYGGVQKEEQRKALKTASIVVATPGRLNDLINEGAADLGSVGYLVLDEADRMLDKGFEEDIKRIINTTPTQGLRQTLMFTATWPQSVRELAATFMTSPVKISIGDNPTGELRANNRITQNVEVVDPRGKETRLLQLIKQHQSGNQKDDRILVFCLYKKEATRVENYLRMKGLRVAGIHGDLSQQQRTMSLDAFKSGKVPLLVATDVAARGLDIPAVKLVVNVTFPLTVEDYVHRIGR